MRTRSSSNLPVVSPSIPSTLNPKRRNRRRLKQPFILVESHVDTMADQRTMAELLRAPTEGYVEAIMVPSILAEQFELKYSLINMMTLDQFFGLEKDHPRDHIRWFNKIASTIKYKDVPNSAIKLMLFPFSLAMAACRNKKDERGIVIKNKARLVAQRYTQEEGIDYDEVFLPVARIKAIRLFLAYASFKYFVFFQIDVKSAFLYGKIEEEKSDGIFISQDKYVAYILKKFDLSTVKTTSTLMEPNKALVKDAEAEDVDVHLYRLMIRSLMYLTTSRPDITLDVCACARFQVTPKTSHPHAIDYAGSGLDRKSAIGGCKFLGKRLISWQCKKQTIAANSTTEAEYVAAASCCGQVLWIQKQMLDYGFNLMNTKIYIDNESTICIVKNLVFHSKTKHIEIRHHFIRCSYEKKLIQVIKIHTDYNITDLLTKAFNVSRMIIAKDGRYLQVKTDNSSLNTVGQRNVTSLLKTMMVNAQEEVGKGSGLYTDSHHTPTNTQPSSFKSQKKVKPKRRQRQPAAIHLPSSEIPVEKSIPTTSNDVLPSGEDSIQHNELMIFCTNLQQQFLDLEEEKIAQSKEIAKLKKRVKNLEKRRKSRPVRLRRLKKICLGFYDLEGNEVFVEKSVEKEVSTADPVTTAGEVVTATSVEDSAAPTTTITADVDDELTLAKTLIAIKVAKPKVILTDIPTPRAKRIVFYEQVQVHKPTVSLLKYKGKAKMIEPEKPLKKKDQIKLDEDVARKLKAEMRAKMEEEERIAREKDEANRAMVEEWDDVQATTDADRQLAEQIQA
nr:putative ribonuclease H-like domain-containing protein [Tanacetum cinerariifolium]